MGPKDPLNSNTLGLMMLLSSFQYQPLVFNPAYTDAITAAGRAAYVESGGKAMQDHIAIKAENEAKNDLYSVGITDTELIVVLGAAKIYRDKQIKFRGPKLGPVKTDLTLKQDGGTLGIKYEW
jgi:hypothetical protein